MILNFFFHDSKYVFVYKKKYLTSLCLVTIVCLNFFKLPDAWGVQISIDAKVNVDNFVDPGEEITLDLLAFTQVGNIKNAVTFDSGTGDPAPELIGEEVIFLPIGERFSPPVGFRDEPRPANERFVTSETPIADGPTLARSAFQPVGVGKGECATVPSISGLVLWKRTRSSAGRFGRVFVLARDPATVQPGNYEYSPVLCDVTIESQENVFGGVSMFAEDSRFAEPLWIVSVLADGLLQDPMDLIIDFESQPLLGLDDTLIEQQVRSAFSVDGNGVATLANYELFNTTYPVDQPIEFAEVVQALVAVAEPTSIALIWSGFLGIGFVAKTKRKLRRG